MATNLFNQNSQNKSPSLFGTANTIDMNSNKLSGSAHKTFAIGTNGNQKNQTNNIGINSQNNSNTIFGGLSANHNNLNNQLSNTNSILNNQNTSSNIFNNQNTSNSIFNNQNTSNSIFNNQNTSNSIFNNQNTSNNMFSNAILSTPVKRNLNNIENNNNNSFASNLTFGNSSGLNMQSTQQFMSNNLVGGNSNQQTGYSNTNQITQQKGTYHIKYNPGLFTELNEQKQNAKMTGISISFHNEISNKQIEELRYEDSQLKKSGIQPPKPATDQNFTQIQNQVGNPTQTIFQQPNQGINTMNQNTFGTSTLFNSNPVNNITQQNQSTVGNSFNSGLFNSINQPKNPITSLTNQNITNITNANTTNTSIFSNQSISSQSKPLFGDNKNEINKTNEPQNNNILGNNFGFLNNPSVNTSAKINTNNNSNQFNMPDQKLTVTQNQNLTSTSNTNSNLFGNTLNLNTSATKSNLFGNFQTTATTTSNNTSLPSNNSMISNFFSNKNVQPNQAKETLGQNEPQLVQEQAMIQPPLNILGINIDSVTNNVRNAVSSNKKIKDFLNEIQDIQYSEYNFDIDRTHNKIHSRNEPYNYTNPSQFGIKVIEDYHSKYNSNYLKRNIYNQREDISDYDYYANFPVHGSTYKDKKNTEDNYLNYKRKSDNAKEADLTRDFNFNRNLIEIRQKYYNERYNSKRGRYEEQKEDNNLHLENIDENIQDFRSSVRPSNGQEKVVQIIIESKVEELQFIINVNKNNQVILLKELILEKLKEKEKSKYKRVKIDNITLIKNNSLMKDTKLISDYDVKNNDRITLTVVLNSYEEENPDLNFTDLEANGLLHKKSNLHLSNKTNAIKYNRGIVDIAPLLKLPILTKSGYYTEPDYKIICRMSTDELKRVENFAVKNEFGKIQWKDDVNLTELNLDDIVAIQDSCVHLYKGVTPTPSKGKGLNKPFIITLKITPNVNMDNEAEKEEFINSLQENVSSLGAKYLDYDEEREELQFYCKEIYQIN